jgi:hypothetical protein
MMKAVRTFEASVYSKEITWRYIPGPLFFMLAAVGI